MTSDNGTQLCSNTIVFIPLGMNAKQPSSHNNENNAKYKWIWLRQDKDDTVCLIWKLHYEQSFSCLNLDFFDKRQNMQLYSFPWSVTKAVGLMSSWKIREREREVLKMNSRCVHQAKENEKRYAKDFGQAICCVVSISDSKHRGLLVFSSNWDTRNFTDTACVCRKMRNADTDSGRNAGASKLFRHTQGLGTFSRIILFFEKQIPNSCHKLLFKVSLVF